MSFGLVCLGVARNLWSSTSNEEGRVLEQRARAEIDITSRRNDRGTRLIVQRRKPVGSAASGPKKIDYRERPCAYTGSTIDERDERNREIERTHIVGGVVQRKPRETARPAVGFSRAENAHTHTDTNAFASVPPRGVCRFLFLNIGIGRSRSRLLAC